MVFLGLLGTDFGLDGVYEHALLGLELVAQTLLCVLVEFEQLLFER